MDGVGSSEGSGTVAVVDNQSQAKEAVPPKHNSQTQVQQLYDLTKSLSPLPSTPGTTTKIFSTNATGEMVVTIVEVNKDSHLRGL